MAEIEDQKNAVQKSAGLNTTDAAAALAAKRELEAARKKLSELQVAAQTAPGPDKPKAYQAADEAQKKVKEAEAKLNALAPQPMAAASAAPMAGATAAPKPAAAPTFVAEHTLAADETLSHLALKYYGHATPPYWQLIYEANKELIGDNPNRVRAGMLIKIPALPAGFKG